MALDDAELRDAAIHRGLKLVKSRKRTPGTGDFGKFGLTDQTGKPLFGIGEQGLTASADEVADYLRKGEASTWAASAKATPGRKKQAPQEPDQGDDDRVIKARPKRAAPVKVDAGPSNDARHEQRDAKQNPSKTAPASSLKEKSKSKPERTKTQEPEAVAKLLVRPGRAADAKGLATLLASLVHTDDEMLMKRITHAIKAKQILVADQDGIIGMVEWQILQLIAGDTLRLGVVYVSEAERRRGVGRQLIDAAATSGQGKGCSAAEAMSEIAVRNANGFFRSLGFNQTSYQFVRPLKD